MRTFPVFDPTSTKYPDRVFYMGRWMTPAKIEEHREKARTRMPDYLYKRGGAEVKKAYNAGPGYLTRRRRDLGIQRERITNQLKELTEDGSQ